MLSDRTMGRAMRLGLWLSVIAGIWALGGVLASLMQRSEDWWPYLRDVVRAGGFAGLFWYVLDLRKRLSEASQ